MSVNISQQGIASASGQVNPNLVPNQGLFTKENPYILTTTSNDGYRWLSGSNFEVKPSTTYMYSVYCDGELASAHTGAQGTFSMWLYLCNDGNASKSASGSYDSAVNFNSGNYSHVQIGNRHIWKYTTTASQRYMSIRLNNYGTGGVTHKYWGFKIEEGTVATPWIPNVNDTNYVGDICGFTESLSLTSEQVSIGENCITATEFIEW